MVEEKRHEDGLHPDRPGCLRARGNVQPDVGKHTIKLFLIFLIKRITKRLPFLLLCDERPPERWHGSPHATHLTTGARTCIDLRPLYSLTSGRSASMRLPNHCKI